MRIITFLFVLFIALQEDNHVYGEVDKPAQPIGGMPVLYKAWGENIGPAKENTCDVWKVYIEFVIEKDGTMSNIKLAPGQENACGSYWIAPLEKISKDVRWQPAKLKDKIVRQRLVLPIAIKTG